MTRKCSAEGCERDHYSNGYCTKHNAQLRRKGAIGTVRAYKSRSEELAAAIASDTDECIIVTGHAHGRVRINREGKLWLASRYVWKMIHGDPGPAHVLHTCNGGGGDNGCINPRHLYLGDDLLNSQDKVFAQRQARGHWHGQAKLSEADVLDIRRRYVRGRPYHPGTAQELANQYGVSRVLICKIVNGEGWAHVTSFPDSD